MIIQLVLVILVIIALSYVYRHLRRRTSSKAMSFKFWLYLTGAVVVLLAATGRIHWITAILAGLAALLYRIVPLALQLLPFLRHWQHGRQNSILQSRYLRLHLDHGSGRIKGEVLQGPHAGAGLDELDTEEMEALLVFYRSNDPESHRLLQAYLEQLGRSSYQQGSASASDGSMSRREALEILGLDENASAADVQQAHKKLMQRLHPDRGGSNYLAAKVNQAKSVLMKKAS